MVRVGFFRESGKWYSTEAVSMEGHYKIQGPKEALAAALQKHLNGRHSGMTAVCLEPYHEFSYPVIVKIP